SMPVQHTQDHVEKRLSSRERIEPEAIARLRSEADLLALLSESGVTPRLLSRGEDEQGPWHRIERVVLPTIAERLAGHEGTPLDASFIEHAARATFLALCAIHEAADEHGSLNVVHADISPANIAIDDHGARAILLDLDLAWWRRGPKRDGAFRGTI